RPSRQATTPGELPSWMPALQDRAVIPSARRSSSENAFSLVSPRIAMHMEASSGTAGRKVGLIMTMLRLSALPLQHFPRMFARGAGDFQPAQHAGDLVHAL